MKALKKLPPILFRGIRGAVADFWMLPIALLIMKFHTDLADYFGLFPTLNPEKVGKIVPALVVFLLVLFFQRFYFWAQYPGIYKRSLMSRRNQEWEKLPSSQQLLYSRIERWVQILAFAWILSSM